MSADATPLASTCPTCHSAIPPASPGGACPRCLMALAFATDPGANPPPDVPADEVHRRFPGYEVLSTIGRGGMGIVYRARQKALDREVALKVLPGGPSRPAGFTDRFAREAKALARLQHPGIVQVFDFGASDDGWCYLAMELVEGANLRTVLGERRLTPREALAIVPQICDALQYAHDHGVVHRDIKPENVLVCRSGARARGDGAGPPNGAASPPAGELRVKIADFGLAKVLEGFPGSSLTHSGHSMGTPLYMAPEQVEHPGDVDHRADIYSLGVVFYEMLTGELPIGRFAPPSRKSDVDARIDEIVLRTLEKEREARFQRASDVKSSVAEASDESASRVVLGGREFRPRRPWMVLAGLLALGGGIAAWGLSRFDWTPGIVVAAAGAATIAGAGFRRVDGTVRAGAEPAPADARTSRLATAAALLVAPVALLVIIGARDRTFSLSCSLPATLLLAGLGTWASHRIQQSRGKLTGATLAMLAVLGGATLTSAAAVWAFSSRTAARFDPGDAIYRFPPADQDAEKALRSLVEKALAAHPVEQSAAALSEFYDGEDVQMLLGLPPESLKVRGGAGHLGLPLVGADFFGCDLSQVSIQPIDVDGIQRGHSAVEIRAGDVGCSVAVRRLAPSAQWRFAASPVLRFDTARPAVVGGSAPPPGRTSSGWPQRGSPTEEDDLRTARETYQRSADTLTEQGFTTTTPELLAAKRGVARADERLREIEEARRAGRAEASDLRGRVQDCLRRIDELVVVKQFTEDHPQIAVERKTIARLEERIRELEAADGRASAPPTSGVPQPTPDTPPPSPEPPK